MSGTLLVRYGVIPEVARFAWEGDAPPSRGEMVVIASRRGVELGSALEVVREPSVPAANGSAETTDAAEVNRVLRTASDDDLAQAGELRRDANASFVEWQTRIAEWNLQLELIDLEWMLDRQKLVLYVLGGRGPDTTRLALQAATAGLAVIEVQPVDASGLLATGGGSGGCGSGGCGCHV